MRSIGIGIGVLGACLACASGPDCPSLGEAGGLRLEYAVDGEGPSAAELDEIRAVLEQRLEARGIACATVRAEGERVVLELLGAQPAVPLHDLGLAGKLSIAPEAPREQVEALEALLVGAEEGVIWGPLGPECSGPNADGRLRAWIEARRAALPPSIEALIEPALEDEGARVRFVLADRGIDRPRVDAVTLRDDPPSVLVALDGPTGAAFGRLSAAHIGEVVVIGLDREVLAAPVVRERIDGGKVVISPGGREASEQAARIARTLRAGSLPRALLLVSEDVIGPAR